MPIAAVAVAGIALSTGGAAAIGAVVAGTATLATTLSAVAAIGATVSAIGAVTGDKTLSTVGMVMGGVGGVGALAANAGLFGAAATTESLFGGTASAADAASASGSSSLINSGVSAADAPAVDTGAAMSDIASSVPSLPGQAASVGANAGTSDFINKLSGTVKPVAAASAATPDTGMETATVTANRLAPTADATSPAASVAPSASGAPAAPQAPSSISAADQAYLQQQYANPTDGTVATNKGTGNSFTYSKADGWQSGSGSGVWGFLKSAGGGAIGMGAIQAAGSFLQGATDSLKPAQVAAYNAQAAANNASAALTQQQVTNMGSAMPVATRVKPPAVTGMINQPVAGGAPA